jgi:predicted dehydrogenase
MAIDMTPEQKELGKANFHRAVGELATRGPTRRQFMGGLIAAGVALPLSAAAYFGYQKAKDLVTSKPVKAALIGAGDEGGVLIGEHNPKYLEFVAVCDIRPTNQDRIFKGQTGTIRKGFENIDAYGKGCRDKKIRVFDDYTQMLNDTSLGIEAVVIALPLHLHAQAAIDCMKAGKDRGKPIHVLCEKLMAWNVSQCKEMIRVAEETDSCLSIGHQRHYSMLYAHAVEVLHSGVLGDIKHIRALWHRNNTWPRIDEKTGLPKTDVKGNVILRDSWRPEVPKEDREALESRIKELGYKSMEELVRWRLYNRTGGGLMAELGSHQLDACSIFLGKVHPLAVSGAGTRSFYRQEYEDEEREVEDHVFVTFEFPGKNYYEKDKNGKPTDRVKDKNDIVVVTYSSINTNSFEPYGECVMGTRGLMMVESEQSIMLYSERDPNVKDAGAPKAMSVTVTNTAAGQTVLDSSATSGAGGVRSEAENVGQKALGPGPISRGYREEMEHFAYCVRMWDQAPKGERELPRCHGQVAMADAIIALAANRAMRHHERVVFQPGWFEADPKKLPDWDEKPKSITG